MKNFNKAIIATTLLAVLGLAGCNTVHGFGQDVSKGGDKLQDTSVNHGASSQ